MCVYLLHGDFVISPRIWSVMVNNTDQNLYINRYSFDTIDVSFVFEAKYYLNITLSTSCYTHQNEHQLNTAPGSLQAKDSSQVPVEHRK